MGFISVYAVAAMVGNGASNNPRRPTLWGRLDSVISVINTQNVCLRPDGTVNIARISEINLGMGLVQDFNSCGIVVQSMDETMWNAINSHLLTTNGYVVLGKNISELKAAVQTALNVIQANLLAGGVILSGTGTLFDQVKAYLIAAKLSGANGAILKGIRDFYVDRLSPPSLVEAPPIIYKLDGNSLDPAKFQALLSAWNNVQATDIAHLLHELYDLACFDVVNRSLL